MLDYEMLKDFFIKAFSESQPLTLSVTYTNFIIWIKGCDNLWN